EVGVGLEGGDEPVRAEREHAGGDPEQAALLPQPLPDEPGAADLGDGGQHEEDQGTQSGHGRDFTGEVPPVRPGERRSPASGGRLRSVSPGSRLAWTGTSRRWSSVT